MESRMSLPSRDEQWRLLLDALDILGRPVEVAPGRVAVHREDDVATVVVTADQWEAVLVNHAMHDVRLYVAEHLGYWDDDERFVVCSDGHLVWSIREELPPVLGQALGRKVAEARTRNPDAEFGWYARPPDQAEGQ